MQGLNYTIPEDPYTIPYWERWIIDENHTQSESAAKVDTGQSRSHFSRTEANSHYFKPKDTTSSEFDNPLLQAIEEAAAKADRETFAVIVRQVPWPEYQPYELTRAIDLCLSLDLLPLALDLITSGRRIFPSDKKIETAARILSPPNIVTARPSRATGIEESKLWITSNSINYKGKWIAVHNGALLAEARTAEALYCKIGKSKKNPNTIIVKVLP